MDINRENSLEHLARGDQQRNTRREMPCRDGGSTKRQKSMQNLSEMFKLNNAIARRMKGRELRS